jgi:hypothetical protein
MRRMATAPACASRHQQQQQQPLPHTHTHTRAARLPKAADEGVRRMGVTSMAVWGVGIREPTTDDDLPARVHLPPPPRMTDRIR